MCARGLETERLLLRPPEFRDVPAITAWAGDYDVAKNLSRMPYPYREQDACAYINRTIETRAAGTDYRFAVTRKSDGMFVGGCGLRRENGRCEMGYWLGKPFWGQGYATETAHGLAAFAFRELGVERVWAGWYHDNPASGRVLEKIGCRPNGAEQRHSLARGHQVYCHLMTLTRADFERKKAA